MDRDEFINQLKACGYDLAEVEAIITGFDLITPFEYDCLVAVRYLEAQIKIIRNV